jgi:hypothetical protein
MMQGPGIQHIAYSAAHEPASRAAAKLPTYRLILRSKDGIGLDGTANDYFKAMEWPIKFDDGVMLPNDAAYQMAVESFVIFADTTTDHQPVMIRAVDMRQPNTFDTSRLGRTDVMLLTTTQGFNQHVTPDTIGIPCAALNLFNSRRIALQLTSLNAASFDAQSMNSGLGAQTETTNQHGDWAISVVLYPL